MLIIKNLTVRYNKKNVLDGLNLKIGPSEIHGLAGLNGSGKTTFFNSLYQLVKAEQGSIEWEGKELNRKNISFLETTNYFYSNITGKEYLELFNSKNNSFDIEMWSDLLKLPLKELVENYSTGMKKKLALLGILKLDKPVLLLDEPFNGVDMETARIFKLVISALKEKGKTIIITSHILETLTSSCDFIHYLEDGKIKTTYQSGKTDGMEQDIFKEMEKGAMEKISKVL